MRSTSVGTNPWGCFYLKTRFRSQILNPKVFLKTIEKWIDLFSRKEDKIVLGIQDIYSTAEEVSLILFEETVFIYSCG